MHKDSKATLRGFSVERANASCSKRDLAFRVGVFVHVLERLLRTKGRLLLEEAERSGSDPWATALGVNCQSDNGLTLTDDAAQGTGKALFSSKPYKLKPKP